MKSSLFVIIASSIILAGCAKNSEKVSATYVSPEQYASLSCDQLSTEAQRLSTRANEVAGVQDKTAKGDAIATGISLILFWPAAFFVNGGKENEAELGRLKGQLEAVQAKNIEKGCPQIFETSAAK